MSEIETTKHVGRRTVLKGAAWSVPVVAAAIAVPAQAASLPNGVDVRVTATCSGQYDIKSLTDLLAQISLLGLPVGLTLGVVTNLVKAALSALGFNEGVTRRFEISAAAGTIPVGTAFQLQTNPGALINLSALQSLLQVQALFVASVNPSGFILLTQQPIGAAPAIVELQTLLLNANVVTQTTLTLLDQDHPVNPATEAPDSAAINTLASVDVDLGTLDLGAQLTAVLPGAANLLLRTAIQAVLGLTGGLTVLDGLKLRVQLCQGV
ncbi:hypothetical protein ACTJI8_13580 [Microbacterium sp. 22303]|uniref:hypothetical protein n=1 Tax=Microbacterium sp. 22303 TaxID=3453905 RepID=UPI003F86A3D7